MAQTPYEVKQVRVQVTRAPFVPILRSEDEWWQVPKRIEATVETKGFELQVVTGLDGTLSPTITEVRITRDPDGPPITDVLRMPADRMLREIIRRGAIVHRRDDEGLWTIDDPGEADIASVAITRGRRSPKQAQQLESEVAAVGELWPEAVQQRAPVEFIRARLGLSRRTAQRRIDSARTRGLID